MKIKGRCVRLELEKEGERSIHRLVGRYQHYSWGIKTLSGKIRFFALVNLFAWDASTPPLFGFHNINMCLYGTHYMLNTSMASSVCYEDTDWGCKFVLEKLSTSGLSYNCSNLLGRKFSDLISLMLDFNASDLDTSLFKTKKQKVRELIEVHLLQYLPISAIVKLISNF